MHLDAAALQQKLRDKLIGGASIDTSVYKRMGFKFASGLLSLSDNFSKAKITLLMTDVVEREVRSHLEADISAASSVLQSSIRGAMGRDIVDDAVLQNVLDTSADPSAICNKMLAAHFDHADVAPIQAKDFASVDEVLKKYFDVAAPFESGKGKKSEFPDAIALDTLKGWAEANNTEVVVFSDDGGWKRFSEKSDRIHWVADLPTFYSAVQETEAYLLRQISDGVKGEFRLQLEEVIRSAIAWWTVIPDASSNHHFEIDMFETGLLSVDVDSVEPEDILTLEREEEKIVVRLSLVCELEFEGTADLGVYDSTDKDFVHLSTETIKTTEEKELDVLVTFSVFRDDGETVLDFEEAELVPTQLHAYFGEIEPDFSDHDDRY